jgi:hypothetical protein
VPFALYPVPNLDLALDLIAKWKYVAEDARTVPDDLA